ncbi:MAG: VOC family protein, partial [Rhizobiales bacterium]|nr:VOC family protein [Hyphomicrobiales bacterium]
MRYLHTMVRVKDVDASLHFYCTLFGLQEVRRHENEKGRFTLVFLAASDDLVEAKAGASRGRPTLELTFNWDPESYTGGRNFGHLA